MAKQVLEKSATHDAKSDEIIKLESDLSAVRNEKDALVRELGRIEGAVLAEERILKREREMATKEENRSVPLRDVESVASIIEGRITELEKSRDDGAVMAFFTFVRRTFTEFVARHRQLTDAGLEKQSDEEMKRLKAEREKIDGKLKTVNEREMVLRKNYSALQADINREKDSGREAERAVFRIMSEENTIRGVLYELKAREEKLVLIEGDFKRELHEVAILLGRDVLGFDLVVVANESGAAISAAGKTGGKPPPPEEPKNHSIKKKKNI